MSENTIVLDAFIKHCTNTEHRATRFRRLVDAKPCDFNNAAADQLQRACNLYKLEFHEYERAAKLNVMSMVPHTCAKRPPPQQHASATIDTKSTQSLYEETPQTTAAAQTMTPRPSATASTGEHLTQQQAKRARHDSPPSACQLKFNFSPASASFSPPTCSLLCDDISPQLALMRSLQKTPFSTTPKNGAFHCSQADTSEVVQLLPTHHIF